MIQTRAEKVVEWPSEHSDKAVREGWDIWDSEGSENGRWQVQRIDDPEAFAEATGGFTPPKLASDDEAFFIVANGTEPHHSAARDFLRDHNPKEYQAVMNFVGRLVEEIENASSR